MVVPVPACSAGGSCPGGYILSDNESIQHNAIPSHQYCRIMDFNSRFGDKIAECERVITHSFSNKLLCGEALNTAENRMSFNAQGDSV